MPTDSGAVFIYLLFLRPYFSYICLRSPNFCLMRYLDPKADLTFKKVFGQHKDLTISLINALLPLPEGGEVTDI